MSHSVPDKEAISEVWKKVKDRSIPLKPMTKAEYDVLDEISKSADAAYLVFDADEGLTLRYKELSITNSSGESVITTDEIYSTEETRIGTWINGKPVYRKTSIGVTSSSIGIWFDIGDPIPNVETFVKAFGVMNNGSLPELGIPSDFTLVGYNHDSKCFSVQVNVSTLLNKAVVVTVEYTKTTD